MASKRKLWNQLGRFATGAVVLCFFMPFFGVSCEGMDIVTVSGADMVGGCRPGGLITEMEDQGAGESPGEGGGELVAKVDKVEREPLAIAAMAAAVALFVLAWVRKQYALIAACLLGLLGVGLLAGLYVKVSGDLDDAVELGMKDKGSDSPRPACSGSRSWPGWPCATRRGTTPTHRPRRRRSLTCRLRNSVSS
jgi:hypothetical protein